MSSKPYMRMFWGDYSGDTRHLTTTQDGAYLLLISHYWSHGSLPDNDRQLARIVKQPMGGWMKMRPVIAAFFEPGWRHPRIEDELARVSRSKKAKTEAAEARWKGGSNVRSGDKKVHHTPPSATITDLPETPLETAEAVCKRIDSALQMHTKPEPEPESREDGSVVKRARHDYARIEFELRRAARLEDSPAITLADVSPIVGLIDSGYDLLNDILPAVRATRRPDGLTTWKYFVNAIIRTVNTRKAASAAATATPTAETFQSTVKAPADDVRNPYLKAALNLRRMRDEEQSGRQSDGGYAEPDPLGCSDSPVLDAERGDDGGWGVGNPVKSSPQR